MGFRYGTCEPPAGGEGCAVPLQVLIEPTCFRRREHLAESLRQTVRGVPAGPLEGLFALHTGDVLIKISGRGRRRAAEALRPLGGGAPRWRPPTARERAGGTVPLLGCAVERPPVGSEKTCIGAGLRIMRSYPGRGNVSTSAAAG